MESKDQQAQKERQIPLTAEFGTLTARGVFAVGDRTFVDRRPTREELRLARAGSLFSAKEDRDAALVCVMLNRMRLSTTEPEVTMEWLDQRLTEEETTLLAVYILSGPSGVKEALESMSPTSPSPQKGESTP